MSGKQGKKSKSLYSTTRRGAGGQRGRTAGVKRGSILLDFNERHVPVFIE